LVLCVVNLIQNLLLHNLVLVSSEFAAHTVLFVGKSGASISSIIFTALLDLFDCFVLSDFHLSNKVFLKLVIGLFAILPLCLHEFLLGFDSPVEVSTLHFLLTLNFLQLSIMSVNSIFHGLRNCCPLESIGNLVILAGRLAGLNLGEWASQTRIRHLVQHLLSLRALFNCLRLLSLLNSFENLLLLEFLQHFPLILNQVAMRKREVIDAFVLVFLFFICTSFNITIHKLLICFDEGLFLYFLIFSSVHLLLIKLVMSKLDQLCFAIFAHSSLLSFPELFLINLLLKVAHDILIIFIVENNFLTKSVARLSLNKCVQGGVGRRWLTAHRLV
jgi:hypothetical protein